MEDQLKSLRLEYTDQIVEVILTGPGRGNAMGPDFWRELPRVFAGLDRDDRARVIVIRGDGGNFSFGLDLNSMGQELKSLMTGQSPATERTALLDMIGELQRAFDLVARCRKPVIAAVDGWCIGGGVDLIAACDIRICSAAARFSLREVKVAIVADLGSLQRLPLIIGEGATRELALTGKDMDAARALGLGLVSRVHETGELLLESARSLAGEIAANPPLVVQGIKRVMNQAIERRIQEGLLNVAVWNSAFLQSRDLDEALRAFSERRPPRFRGE